MHELIKFVKKGGTAKELFRPFPKDEELFFRSQPFLNMLEGYDGNE
ncbi:hypothetical protein BSUW23_13610 [Bacillus spizizenii str. W23]|uniref:Uncharacterized protein n=1 Tax=Bacillus spizizenii (strain ATCC 23059 / NRRL B-14472 / W23) TaxID=655816 RepID=E0TV88_BACSH|nr:hypothetical protein BSUW23_13610 [Bacillus spizizenii str. W23]EFG92120.1 hypothetical protein BSU6633_11083 [Bacillus spizizenii ATCC 6633 = JCM 2499]